MQNTNKIPLEYSVLDLPGKRRLRNEDAEHFKKAEVVIVVYDMAQTESRKGP